GVFTVTSSWDIYQLRQDSRERPPAPLAGFAAALGRGVVIGSEAAAFVLSSLQAVRDHWVHILVPVGFVFGWYLDKKNDVKLIAFQNKSLLFKRELRPNEEVTWK
ncbi:NADH dehydrogenase [ubiquinone] 1 beta subcomplex subunit 1-like, partial [Camelus dromedarius]|uniref:NADH dehydrogenase [ubiquinone] 1 beta subcomplex subunit 1-like n=1 Tax=Camelus dromedarius TaxID=9838 RepID=UPI003119E212